MDGMIPLWNESLLRASGDTVDLAAESMLLFTFSRLTDSRGSQGQMISRILARIDERFTEPGFTIAALAQEMGYSPKYMSSVIKHKTGTGFSEYLQKRRISYAVTLFDHGLDSVKNVAFLSGYADPLYFSTAFKRHTGLSPREYCSQQNRPVE
jgi:AraC-like DNA-binding protein